MTELFSGKVSIGKPLTGPKNLIIISQPTLFLASLLLFRLQSKSFSLRGILTMIIIVQ